MNTLAGESLQEAADLPKDLHCPKLLAKKLIIFVR